MIHFYSNHNVSISGRHFRQYWGASAFGTWLLGGLGASYPRKFWKLGFLKWHLQHSESTFSKNFRFSKHHSNGGFCYKSHLKDYHALSKTNFWNNVAKTCLKYGAVFYFWKEHFQAHFKNVSKTHASVCTSEKIIWMIKYIYCDYNFKWLNWQCKIYLLSYGEL